MKPYGVRVEEFPDVGDIIEMGAKSSTGRIKGRGGEFRAYCRNAKRKTRRYWKRLARRLGLAEIEEGVAEAEDNLED